MAIQKYEDLTPLQLDALKEVGNIGSGNASTALSNMISKNVQIEMPNVRILGFQEAIDELGGAERLVAGVLSRMVGDIEGMILTLMHKDFVNTIVGSFFSKNVDALLKMSEVETSALAEVGNIMAGAYVSAIGQLTGLQGRLRSPLFQVDMIGALMSVPVIELGEVGEKILYIDKQLSIDGQHMASKLMLIPTIDSLEKIMEKLGIDT